LTSKKSEIISIVEHDHNYDVSPLVLRKRLIQSQEMIRIKTNIIKLQKRQLQCLNTCVIGLKKTITELRHERMCQKSA